MKNNQSLYENKTVTTVTVIKAAQNCLSIIKAVILIVDQITVEFLSLTGLLMGGSKGSVLVEGGYLVT